MKNIYRIILAVLVVTLLTQPVTVSAQYAVAQPPSRQFLIEKNVLNPRTNTFVENLTIDQFQFLPGQEVRFRITVKNTSGSDLANVSVTDRLPAEVSFVSGDGTFDTSTNTVKMTIDRLNANSSKSFDIKVNVKSDAQLMSNVICPTNLAELRVDNSVVQATSSFCIQKKVLGVVSELPVTGPEQTTVALVISGLAMVLSLGLFMSLRLFQKGQN